MSKFKWKKDNMVDWTPWVITIIARNMQDDCDGAAILAKWWYKKHSSRGKIVSLYSKDLKVGHAVCVRQDHKEVVSNQYVLPLDPSNWKSDLLSKFNGEFSILVES